MADFGSFFGGFSNGWIDRNDQIIGQRQKVAEMFNQFRTNNPTATFEQYQAFLDQAAPDRLLRGNAYTDQVLQQYAAEGARKQAVQAENDRLGVIQKQIETQDKYRTFVENTVNQTLAQSGENDTPDDLRIRVKKALASSGVPTDGAIGSIADSYDYTGRLKQHRLDKLKNEQADIQAAQSLFEGSDLPPEAIEAELKNKGFSPAVAASARKRIETARNDKRSGLITGLQDSLDKNPSTEGILLDPSQSLGDYVEAEARKRQITLSQDEKDAIRNSLELRRKQAIERRDSQEVEQTTKAKQVADSLAQLETEDEVKQSLNGQNFSQGMRDAVLGQWRSNRNTVYRDRMNALREQLNPAKNLEIAGYVAEEKPEQIKLMIQNYVRDNKIVVPEENIDSLVREFMGSKLAIANKSIQEDMATGVKFLQDRMQQQTQTNVKTFQEMQQQTTRTDEKKLYAVAMSVAARNVDATVGTIMAAVRKAKSDNPNATDADIVDKVTSILPNAQQAIVNEQNLYKSPIDQKKAVAELYAGIGRVNDATYQLEERVQKYMAGDTSALGGLTPKDYKERVVPAIVADINKQLSQISQMLRMRNSSMVNLTPEGADKFEQFATGLLQLKQRIEKSVPGLDIAKPAAGADLERRRIDAEGEQRRIAELRAAAAASPSPTEADRLMRQADDAAQAIEQQSYSSVPYRQAAAGLVPFMNNSAVYTARLEATAQQLARENNTTVDEARNFLDHFARTMRNNLR